jgi:hypothetical protein
MYQPEKKPTRVIGAKYRITGGEQLRARLGGLAATLTG